MCDWCECDDGIYATNHHVKELRNTDAFVHMEMQTGGKGGRKESSISVSAGFGGNVSLMYVEINYCPRCGRKLRE